MNSRLGTRRVSHLSWVAAWLLLLTMVILSAVATAAVSAASALASAVEAGPFGRTRTWRLLKRDMTLYYRYGSLRLHLLLTGLRGDNVTDLFRRTLRRHPHRTAFVDDATGRNWSYQDLEDRSNQVANLFLSRGFRKGDVVALAMENRTEYIAIQLGLGKIGVVVSLVNTNLRNESLVHVIMGVVQSRAVIYGIEQEKAIQEVLPALTELDPSAEMFCSRSGSSMAEKASEIAKSVDLDAALSNSSRTPEPASVAAAVTTEDPLVYIYTSGTTGMPKAVVIKHFRQQFAGLGAVYTLGISSTDVVYNCLPLYHSSGNQLGCSFALFNGTTTVIKRKFSASNYWTDCEKYGVTVGQYIGELARYLYARPPGPEDRRHRVRLMYGNGLRPQLWPGFVRRFGIATIHEVYGSTEGNCTVINLDNKVGSCGFVPRLPEWLLDKVLPVVIVRVDRETGEPIRDKDGWCVRADTGEPGELIGRIVKGDPVKDFQGYAGQKDSSKKRLNDVFKRGDSYFRSGDIISVDGDGYFYFHDRAGDTFRWKGENVSTTEVEKTVSQVVGTGDAMMVVSYGVTVPGCEGRASMIALPKDADVDMAELFRGMQRKLPGYARPVFVRMAEQMQMTSTFKLKKTSLQDDGFDVVNKITSDPVFFMDSKAGAYVPLTKELAEDINQGRIRF